MFSIQQQQASNYEIYEILNKMCNEIGCPLKFYEDKILPFGDKSGASAAAQRKADKKASDASSRVSKDFLNKLI